MSKKVRKTKVSPAKPAFTALVKDAELAMNLSYGSSEAFDSEGNKVQVYLWVNGDWKVSYKDKEYIIPMSDNVNALIDWINQEKK